jgi:nucleotide-binding universal stress UspA family protein
MKKKDVKPVVVATDLSDGGDEAVRQADGWARRSDRPLLVVHAVPDAMRIEVLFPQESQTAMQKVAELQERAAAAVSARVAQLTGRSDGDFQVVVQPGSPHGVVLDVAEDRDAALVAVGATGRGAVSRLLLGSSAEAVVRHAQAPVLVARPSPSSGLVMAATDLSDPAIAALAAAADEARRRKARIMAVHCIELVHPMLATFEPSLIVDGTTLSSIRAACKHTLEAQLARVEASGEARVVEGRPTAAVVKVAQDDDAELLVVGTHGRTGLARLALGSVAAVVARDAPCSVLVVRTP